MITRKYKCHVEWDLTYYDDYGREIYDVDDDDDDIELPTTLYAHLSFDREPTDEDINDALVDILEDEVGYDVSSLSYEEV